MSDTIRTAFTPWFSVKDFSVGLQRSLLSFFASRQEERVLVVKVLRTACSVFRVLDQQFLAPSADLYQDGLVSFVGEDGERCRPFVIRVKPSEKKPSDKKPDKLSFDDLLVTPYWEGCFQVDGSEGYAIGTLPVTMSPEGLCKLFQKLPREIVRVPGASRYVIAIDARGKSNGKLHTVTVVVTKDLLDPFIPGTASRVARAANDNCNYCHVVHLEPSTERAVTFVARSYWDAYEADVVPAVRIPENVKARLALAHMTVYVARLAGAFRHQEFVPGSTAPK